MNIESAVFGMISIKPQPIHRVVSHLPYSRDSIYNAIESMQRRGNLIKTRIKGEIKLDIPKDYFHQKKREFYIKSLSYGIDPEILLRKSSKHLWKALDKSKEVYHLSKETNLSKKTVRKLLHQFYNYGLIKFKRRKPLIVEKVKNHPINDILYNLLITSESSDKIYASGSIPFEEIVTTPDEIENILYNKIDKSITVKKTGFLLRGTDENIEVIESVPKKLSLEEIFMKKLFTPEGVEDYCIRLIASKKIDFEKLLKLSIKKKLVNCVGCYLDIINDINHELVSKEIIKKFNQNIFNKKYIFLKYEKKYGKMGWENKYEKKWNVDLYLDLGAIKHGVRSL